MTYRVEANVVVDHYVMLLFLLLLLGRRKSNLNIIEEPAAPRKAAHVGWLNVAVTQSYLWHRMKEIMVEASEKSMQTLRIRNGHKSFTQDKVSLQQKYESCFQLR